MLKRYIMAMMLFVCLICSHASDINELTKESIEQCRQTAYEKPTPETIVTKVNEACDLIEAEGKAAFRKFRGKDSDFIFSGTYIWVHDFSGKLLMHPIYPKAEGKSFISMRDSTGKYFIVEMNMKAKSQGHGWVDYSWPKPGTRKLSSKISYIKVAKLNGRVVVVGCGFYGLPDNQIFNLVNQD